MAKIVAAWKEEGVVVVVRDDGRIFSINLSKPGQTWDTWCLPPVPGVDADPSDFGPMGPLQRVQGTRATPVIEDV